MQDKNLTKTISIFTQNRVKIMLQLFECKEIQCGCDLVAKIKIPKNLLSYHISFLIKNNLIEEKKCGQKKNYSLTKKGIEITERIIEIQNII